MLRWLALALILGATSAEAPPACGGALPSSTVPSQQPASPEIQAQSHLLGIEWSIWLPFSANAESSLLVIRMSS